MMPTIRMRPKKHESVWTKASRLALGWSRSKPHSDAQYRIVAQIDNFTLLLLFFEDIRNIHEASDSESGFNHEVDTLAIILQDVWGIHFTIPTNSLGGTALKAHQQVFERKLKAGVKKP